MIKSFKKGEYSFYLLGKLRITKIVEIIFLEYYKITNVYCDKSYYLAALLSIALAFGGLIPISIVNSSEENEGPANETSADRDYYSNSINGKQNIVDMRVWQ
jgi:hypothetical protein